MHLIPSKFGVTSKLVPSLSKPEIYTHDYYNDPKIIIEGAHLHFCDNKGENCKFS